MTSEPINVGLNHDRIVQTAFEILNQEGIHAVRLKSIAHNLDVTSPALYNYFRGRLSLIVALRDYAYEQFAAALNDALTAAPPRDHAERLRAVAHGYRQWALQHPEAYLLIFNTTGAGSTQSAEDDKAPTGQQSDNDATDATRPFRLLGSFLDVLTHARANNQLTLPYADRPMPRYEEVAQAFAEETDLNLEPALLRAEYMIRARIHGIVSLEIAWPVIRGPVEELFDTEIETLVRELGLS